MKRPRPRENSLEDSSAWMDDDDHPAIEYAYAMDKYADWLESRIEALDQCGDDEIGRTITVPEYRELTPDDYVVLLYASVSDLDTGYPRLSPDRFDRLKTLGFVRKAATLEESAYGFVPVCATTEGREAAMLYLQQMLASIGRTDENEKLRKDRQRVWQQLVDLRDALPDTHENFALRRAIACIAEGSAWSVEELKDRS